MIKVVIELFVMEVTNLENPIIIFTALLSKSVYLLKL